MTMKGCGLGSMILLLMKLFITSDGTNERLSYMYFGHSETVNPFHVVFGLYNSSHPLVASDWPELATSHPWQTSKMLGFSHNLALVAMDCPEREETLQVAFFHQV